MTRAFVDHETFDIQPISVSGKLHGEGIKSLRAQTTAAMLGVDVELSSTTAAWIPTATPRPPGLMNIGQSIPWRQRWPEACFLAAFRGAASGTNSATAD